MTKKIPVHFEYSTGTTQDVFHNVRLTGSWTSDGHYSDQWRTVPMKLTLTPCGSSTFTAEVLFAEEDAGKTFSWAVVVDTARRSNVWGIPTESGPADAPAMYRTFTLEKPGSREHYLVNFYRRLGANKYYREGGAAPSIIFSVWAPYAQKIETVVATDDSNGYIWSDGRGVKDAFAMTRDDNGIWSTDPDDPAFADYAAWEGKQYMFKITREDGSVRYRTDLYSRSQAGTGGKNPEEEDWDGTSEDLDSTKSCSVVVDPETVTRECRDKNPQNCEWQAKEAFWEHEFDPLRPLPTSIGDMVIYEMHIAGLGAGKEGPGTFQDAMDMLDYLVDLGVNAIELLPTSGFEGEAGWGYGTAHYYSIKYDSDDRNQFKHFVRACHRHGIAVIVDVVYNHYTPKSERAQWLYDTHRHDHNINYFYKGTIEDYPEDFPEGGYSDNYSTGYLPNMCEEMVRKMLIGSAVSMAMEFHVDGFRVDLTQALHSFNVLHADGSPLPEANEAGTRFMREWVRTLRLFKPHLMLLAEDHSGWNMINLSQRVGGIGFDATWWSDWYHQLIGDATQDESKARLLHNVGYGVEGPLRMDIIGEMMQASPRRVVYHESHDEAGNSESSARTLQVAVNGVLFDNTRPWAEARCRVVTGLTVLSAGTPMFFMGEEVGAVNPYRYGDFLDNREDFMAMRESSGAALFRFYQDIIRLRLETPAFRSPLVEILMAHNEDRILAYRRWWGEEEFVVIATLNLNPHDNGYVISHDSLQQKNWIEILNSDSPEYGGFNILNEHEMESITGSLNVRLPATGIVVLARKN